jgi:hypothetical protein
VLVNVSASLNSRELTEVRILMAGSNLDEEDEGLGLRVELLL